MKEELLRRATALGFARMGVARAEPLGEEGEALGAWLADGCHGDMGYMADTRAVRVDPTSDGMLPSARSIVVLATPYAREETPQGPAPGRVARYAQGRDYHNVLYKRMRKLAAWLREQGVDARAAVDTMPVFERAWAERSGVGFVGKNCCVIVPGLGSHVFLSALVTSASLEADAPAQRRCGQCTLCLDACPTSAFRKPRSMDARRCISYLTIEHRGPIEPELRPSMGDWLFGCDVCQDVCPFNATAPEDAAVTEPFATDPRWSRQTAADLLELDGEGFAAYAQGSAIKRAGRDGLARNAAIVLGNSGDRVHLPILENAVRSHGSEMVREAATWALDRLNRGRSDRDA